MKHLILLLLLALSLNSIAVLASDENKIISPKNCFRGNFSSYDTWLNFLSKKPRFNKERFMQRFPEKKFNDRKANVNCVSFIYKVGDLNIEGFYVKPKTPTNQKLPVVIYNRGGNARYGYVNFAGKMDFISDIATAGFIVIGSQYRGSSSKFITNNGQDEFGGKDVEDVVKLVNLLQDIPEADATKIALVGWSRGAKQAFLAAEKIPNVKTIVAIAGNADAIKALEWRPAMENVYLARVPGFKENRLEELKKRSVLYRLEKLPIELPVLLIHGTGDKKVNVQQSERLARAFSLRKQPHKLVVYPGDGHGLSKNRQELNTEVISWLKQLTL